LLRYAASEYRGYSVVVAPCPAGAPALSMLNTLR
jgi:hypothetical protein